MFFVYFVCFVVSIFTILPTRAELVVYPDYPEQIERDYAYAVRVVQGDVKKPLVVYNLCE